MELRIWMRKQQRYDKSTQSPVVYSGPNPQSIITTPGLIPNNNWQDFTDDISDLSIKLTWTEELDANNNKSQLPYNNQTKSASNSLIAEGDAYQFIKSWLVDDVAAPLNAVEVKIEYVGCATFEDWSIEYQQIGYCEDGKCQYDLTLKQKDPLYHCIQNTLINDNWQGWFQAAPANGKKHPRFSYCNEIRPNGMLVMQWWMTGVVAGSTLMVMIPLLLLINSIIFAINGLIAVVNLFSGNPIQTGMIPFIKLSDIIDSYTQYYIESAGCGREHPAALNRDYISNVCDKCGVLVDSSSFPLFFSPVITYETSTGVVTESNEYYNTCTLFAPEARGIRRFYNINIFGAPQANNTDFWIEANAPDIALSDFLDKLAYHYHSEWRIRNGTLYFETIDAFKNKVPVYDFTTNAPDRLKLIEGICYEFGKVNYPAFVDGLYEQDPIDSCGNEAMSQTNGPAIPFSQYENQPNFSGELELDSPFGAAKFRLDGASTDYICDAMQVVLNGQILQPWTIGQMSQVASWLSNYADYGLLLRDETCSKPKQLIWDGIAYENAKCIRTKSAWDGTSNLPMPTPNTVYNKAPQLWKQRHLPKTFVIGGNVSFAAQVDGVYTVQDYFGIDLVSQPALLVNYPQYFEPGYHGTLWDRFFWKADPRQNPSLNKRWNLKIPLCCDDIHLLGIQNDARDNKLSQAIKVTGGQYYNKGKITEITASFDPKDRVGLYLEIKGIV